MKAPMNPGTSASRGWYEIEPSAGTPLGLSGWRARPCPKDFVGVIDTDRSASANDQPITPIAPASALVAASQPLWPVAFKIRLVISSGCEIRDR